MMGRLLSLIQSHSLGRDMPRFNWGFQQCREALFGQQHKAAYYGAMYGSAAGRAQYEDFAGMYNMGNEL